MTQNVTFSQILLGLRDQDNSMVALSLHALADLVPVLGSETVIGVHGQHIFKHSTPKVGIFLHFFCLLLCY